VCSGVCRFKLSTSFNITTFSSLFYSYCAVRINTADGNYCLTTGSDRTIRLWNPSRLDPAFPPSTINTSNDYPVERLPRALPIQKYEVRHAPSALAVHPEGTQLLTASDKAAVLLDTVTTQIVRQWHGHTAVINDVAFHHHSQAGGSFVAATASYDATVCLWDGRSSTSHQPLQTLKEAKDSVTAVEWIAGASASTILCTASVDGCLRTYDVRKGVMTCDDYGSPITGISVSRGGINNNNFAATTHPWVAVSCLDGSIRVTSTDKEESHMTLGTTSSTGGAEKLPVLWTCRGLHVAGRYALECCFNADASLVASCSVDGRVALYDSRSLVRAGPSKNTTLSRPRDSLPHAAGLWGHQAPACSVAAHPRDTDVVITASYDGNCVVWASSQDYMRWEGS